MLKRVLIIHCLFLFISFCGCTKNEPSPTGPDNSGYISDLEKMSDDLITKDSIPAVIIGIWDESKNLTWIKAKGKANKNTGMSISLTDEVRTGSTTKTMVATIILQLVDEGKLTLNDKIDSYFPDFPSANQVTVKMLLNMTSGIFDYHYSAEIESHLLNSPLTKYTMQELVDIAAHYPYYFTPGTSFHYSNTNYVMLALIIEKITGNPAQEELRNRIWNKYGMAHTYYPDDQNFKGEFAHGYSSDPRINNGQEFDVSNYYDPSWLGIGCGVISNLYDLKKWTDVLVSGELLSDSLKLAQKNFGIYNYGFGLYDVYNNFNGHDGMVIGYTAVIGKSPSSNTTIIVLTTRAEAIESPSGKYAWNILNDICNILGY